MHASSIRAWLPPALVGAGVSALVGSLAGIATMAGWLPTSGAPGLDQPAPRASAPMALGPAPAAHDGACGTCGVVESVRAVRSGRDADGRPMAGGPPADEKRMSYRVTVRMDDGSYRTLPHAAPPAVAVGDPVRVADGAVVARR
jgi:hypothetical protein